MKPFQTVLFCVNLVLALTAVRAKASFLVVSNSNDTGPNSLRWAVRQALTNESTTILFDPNVATAPIFLRSGQIVLDKDMVIDATTAGHVTILGYSNRVFQVKAGAKVTLKKLSLNNGQADRGGAFLNEGTLTLSDCELRNNSAVFGGGGANGEDGILVINACKVAGNFASQRGGGLDCDKGQLTVSNAEFVLNTTTGSGGAMDNVDSKVMFDGVNCTSNSAALGGAICNNGSSLSVRNSGFFGNVASDSGGAIWGSMLGLQAVNCSLSGNVAGKAGGGIYNDVDFTLDNTIVTSNSAPSGSGVAGDNAALTLTLTNGATVTGNLGGTDVVGYQVIGAKVAPTIISESAHVLSGQRADLDAIVNPGGTSGQILFLISENANAFSPVYTNSYLAANNPFGVSNVVSGLLPGASYRFHAVLFPASGAPVTGSNVNFTIPPQ